MAINWKQLFWAQLVLFTCWLFKLWPTLGSKMSISSSANGMTLGRNYLFAWVLANGVQGPFSKPSLFQFHLVSQKLHTSALRLERTLGTLTVPTFSLLSKSVHIHVISAQSSSDNKDFCIRLNTMAALEENTLRFRTAGNNVFTQALKSLLQI